MTTPFIYVVLIVCFGLLGLAFWIKDWVFGIISGMLLIVCGVYVLSNGILDIKDGLTFAFGIVMIGLGLYVMFRGALEKIKEAYG